MRKIGSSISTSFLRFLHQHTILALGILFFSGMILILGDVFFLAQRTNEELAVQYAALYIRSIEKFRSEYAAQVVSRVEPQGILVTHDYLNYEGAIPIPATFAIDLSERISEPQSGIKARLYSDYPFPWREDGGPHDEFETEALVRLRMARNVEEPYFQFEDVDGRWSLRYAKAVTMGESCVVCHNTHEDSPKTNWVEGDVRGIQEVIIPMDSTIAAIKEGLLTTLGMMLLITVAGLAILALVIGALRSSIKMLSLTNTAYSRFVPIEFLSLLGKKSIVDVGLADHIQRDMTILFSDIRSFTTISENMLPEENFQFINSFLSQLGPTIREHDGFIDKFIGDAIMALFNNPNDAVDAAVGLINQLAIFNQQRKVQNQPEINIGIGLNTGRLMLGTIGENDRMDGTVISDAVNVASRLEGLTKLFGVMLLISEDTYRAMVEPERYLVRLIDRVQVKGKTAAVTVYEVFSGDVPEIQLKKLTIKQDFENALRLYQLKLFQDAKLLFEKCLIDYAEDKATAMYIQRCNHNLTFGVDEEWNGVFQMTSK